MYKNIKNKYTRLLAEFLTMFTICNIIMLFLSFNVFYSFQNWLQSISYSMIIGYILMKGNTYIGNKLDKHISWIQSPIKRIVLILLLGSIFSTLVVFNYSTIFFLFVLKFPVAQYLSVTFYTIKFTLVIYLVVSFLVYAFVFYFKWRNLALEQEKQKNESLRLQFNALRNHVNPHFLFNSLSTLTHLIEIDKHKAITFVNNLSETYRYIIDNKDRDLVSLAEEMEFVQSYLSLQTIRYENLIEIQNKVTGNIEHYQVIPVSIQILIENVFKHNIIARGQSVTICLWIENDTLFVKNNINPKKQTDDRVPTGLANIRSRYEYLSNRPCQFGIVENDFVVALPLINQSQLQ